MKPILIRLSIALSIIIIVFIIALKLQNNSNIDEISGQMLVAINEIQNGDESAQTRYDELKIALKSAARGQNSILLYMWLSISTCAVFSLYLYFAILKPFHKLEKFAQDVASGDYDKSLGMPRHNVFGEFSWAFDFMREGLHDARQAEQEAKAANKLLIATISHDIKTPIASIRASAEGLLNGQASTSERKRRYLDTIIRKSDEVSRLTNDLFLHAISDMNKLIIEPQEISLHSFVSDFTASMDITIECDVPDVKIISDEKRMNEIFGNIVHNSEKYAPNNPVKLSFSQDDGILYCIFSDKGTSLAPEDVPFIFDKFYRGKNAHSEYGSGLGLYIVRYIAEKLGGRAFAQRTSDGLKIFVGFRLKP